MRSLLWLLMLCATTSYANCEYRLPDTLSSSWKIKGSGTLNYWGFDVYNAALLLPANKDFSEKEPFALALCYRYDIKGSDIVDKTISSLIDLQMLDEKDDAPVRQQLAFFPSVKEGDTLTGVYQSLGTATIFLNGQQVGELSKPLATHFFQIWLNENTEAPDLRKNLLGKL